MSVKGTSGEVAADWLSAVGDALAARLGAGASSDLLERLRPAVPAGYDELNWPNSAALDLPIVDVVSRSASPSGVATPTVATSVMHFEEAGPTEWRFRVYRSGAAVALSDLLPLLDQLGFRAIDERAFHFAGAVDVWVHDVGVEVPGGVRFDPEVQDRVQEAFRASFEGRVEVDGFNRLVLLAGLTAREVEILRAYARYLRQIGFPFSQQFVEGALGRHPDIARRLVGLFAARFDPARWSAQAEALAAGKERHPRF